MCPGPTVTYRLGGLREVTLPSCTLVSSSVRGILTPTLQNCGEGERGNDERHPEQVLACR